MQRFEYTAKDGELKTVRGHVFALNAAAAKAMLLERGLESITLEQNSASHLSAAEVASISDSIVTLTSAGLPLAEGLRAVADDITEEGSVAGLLLPGWLRGVLKTVIGPFGRTSRTRRALLQMAEQIEAGDDLSNVLQRWRAPADIQAAVTGGIRTGSPVDAITEYSVHAQSVRGFAGRAASILAYPLLVVAITIPVLLLILIGIVPQFEDIFEGLDAELPAITIFVLGVGSAAQSVWIAATATPARIVLTVAGFLLTFVVLRWLLPRRWLHYCLNRIPLVGRVFQWAAMARFSHLFAVLIRHQMPLAEALRTAGNGVESPDICDAAFDLADQVESGAATLQLKHRLEGFPIGFLPLLTSETSRDGFPDAMHAFADMYASRSRIQAALVAVILELQLLVLGVALPVGITVIALILPLWVLLHGFV